MIKRENSSIGTYSQSETEQALKCLQCTHCSENALPVFAAVTDTRAIQATRTQLHKQQTKVRTMQGIQSQASYIPSS